jgi:hypothetical protein
VATIFLRSHALHPVTKGILSNREKVGHGVLWKDLDRTIIHFEIPANNPEKLSEFYKNLFGWKIEKMSMGEAGDYWTIETRAGTAQNMEKAMSTAGVNGGMMKKMDANQRPARSLLLRRRYQIWELLQSG